MFLIIRLLGWLLVVPAVVGKDTILTLAHAQLLSFDFTGTTSMYKHVH